MRLTNPSSIDTTFFNQFDIEKENINLYNQSIEFLRLYVKDIVSGNIKKRNRLGAAIYERDLLNIYKRSKDRMGEKTASHGQCVPGGRKLFVSCDGDLYPCERVSEKYKIGNINEGINFKTIFEFLENWSKLFYKNCNSCWAIRLCNKCFSQFDPSSKFQNNSLFDFCKKTQKHIEANLVNFCSILEINPDSLNFMDKINTIEE